MVRIMPVSRCCALALALVAALSAEGAGGGARVRRRELAAPPAWLEALHPRYDNGDTLPMRLHVFAPRERDLVLPWWQVGHMRFSVTDARGKRQS